MSAARIRAVGAFVLKLVHTQGVVILLVAALGVNVMQRAQLQRVTRPPAGVAAGTLIPELRLQGQDGVPIVLKSDRRPTILYYFSPACGWCARNWANVEALEKATRDRYRLVAVTERDVADLAARRAWPFEVYGGLDRGVRARIGLGGTPETLVVSPDGRVVKAWAGAFNGRLKQELEKYFGAPLPGLSEAVRADRR